MLQVTCEGSPYEIGYHHGHLAKALVAKNVEFSLGFIRGSNKRAPGDIDTVVNQLQQSIQSQWPRYYEEMQGLADGAGRCLAEIILLNTRTELAYGLAGDGCTSVYARGEQQQHHHAWQGQNWDFLVQPKDHLIQLTIHQPALPSIMMITEAGLIGKIGINSAGVGVTYNALHVRGFRPSGLPSHLALRMALESTSPAAAVQTIAGQEGMAASAFILVGDRSEARGIEFTYCDVAVQSPDPKGHLVHTNHCLMPHLRQVVETDPLPDSWMRDQRMNTLLDRFDGSEEQFLRLWEDEDNYPQGICRAMAYGKSRGETLFNIVMDLVEGKAIVRVGRPIEPEETLILQFSRQG
ncbi:hypothetical protein FE257_002498 [Aspergillus nanangensis]|uniref:Peptidase C45 hydrolase domain-containing protein n=1 Tax=Aspergillus nanangensis TaxID=2582783 RepID=A0AAD4GWN6_ASPNN|nr:hypothetical protein FE257_002498 [Aspergillus nanangensis]